MKLRYYQQEAVDQTIQGFRDNKDKNPLIVLPTGSGKSLVLSEITKIFNEKWNTKVLILSHVQEILEQDYRSVTNHTGLDVGLYSAGLGRKEIKDVTIAGIQSVYRSPELFSDFRLIIIDEAHLVSFENKTMYKTFITALGRPCIGLTATPFRLGSGYIYGKSENLLFDYISSDWGSEAKFNKLIKDGYICKLTTKRTNLEMDTTGIKLIGGDFSEKELSEEFDREAVTNEAIKEILAAGANRKKWLIFAIDINHAEHIAEILIRNGIATAPVHSKMKDTGFCRTKTIEGYKNGKYKCVVNVNILTTGFDDSGIDLIACLRPTNSPVLHVQSLGRGSRIEAEKKDCLVLDFAGNTSRLGPINNVLVKVKGKGKEGGDPITKTCPECDSILPPAVRVCPDCGYKFRFEHGLSAEASHDVVISDGRARWVNIDSVNYNLNINPGSPTSLKVTYKFGKRSVKEWVCCEHKGFAYHKAQHWIKYRGGEPCNTASELLSQSSKLRTPYKILVSKKGKYDVISDAKFK